MLNREDLLSGTRNELGNRILLTVENHFQGYEIIDYKGMVWGISMRSKDMGQDFLMGCKQVTGGELSSYTELADEGRQRAIDRMVSMARRINANAVINFKFEQSLSTYNSNTEVTAFGNAVLIKPIKNYVPTGGLGNILVEFYDLYSKNNGGNNQNNIQEKIQSQNNQIYPNGKLVKDKNENKYVLCPNCSMKYGVEILENGQIQIRNYEDVDSNIKGQQVNCSNCGQIFTVPLMG